MKAIFVIFLLIGANFALPTVKVVGGRDAREHEAPYIVSLQVDRLSNGNFRHVCGGSILTPTWILSAAHCITEVGFELDYRVVAGQHNLAVESGREQARKVVDIKIHENFRSGPQVGPFDVAVFGLESSLNLISGIVEKIDLPTRNLISTGDVQLFGWGSTSDTTVSSNPDILQTVEKPIIQWAICEEIVNAIFDHRPLHSSNFCTGPLSGGISGCHG